MLNPTYRRIRARTRELARIERRCLRIMTWWRDKASRREVYILGAVIVLWGLVSR